MVRPCSDPRCLNAQVRVTFTAQHVRRHLPVGVPAMKMLPAMAAGSLGVTPSLVTLVHAAVLQSSKETAPHSSTLAWQIPWMEEPGGLQSMGSLGVGHD